MSRTARQTTALLLGVVLLGGAVFVAPSASADATAANGEVVFNDSDIPDRVPIEAEVNGSITVTNTGSESMRAVVKSYFQGSQFNTRRVTLAPGESKTFDVSRRVPEITPGNYTIEFTTQNDTLTAEVQVVPSAAQFERPDDGNDVIDTPELLEAIRSWARGDISTDLLQDVINAWASFEPVG